MKIQILERPPTGGPTIFLKRLRQEMRKREILVPSRASESMIGRYRALAYYLTEDSDVFITSGGMLSPVYLKLLQKAGKKVVCRLDGCYYKKYPLFSSQFINGVRNFRLWASKRVSDLNIYQSRFSKQLFSQFIGQAHGLIIPNGVNTDKFTPLGEKFNSNHDLVLVSSHMLQPHKRLHDTIRMLPYLLKEIKDTALYVAGAGARQDPYVSYLHRLIRKYDLKKNVIFLGKIPHDKMPSFYRSCDITAHPSWIDPCPNAVIESMACGTPVICTDTGGTPEVVGDSGIVLEEDFELDYKSYDDYKKIHEINPEKYAERVMIMEEKLKWYSEKARKRVLENFDIKLVCDKYIEACKKALEA